MTRKLSPEQVLPLVYTVNREFVKFALVSIYSAIKTQTRRCQIHLVHDGDLDDCERSKIRRFIERQDAKVDFHTVPDDFPREFARHSRWDVSVLYRLALTQILPPDVSRVVYLDSDTLVRRSLDAMIEIDLGAPGFAAVPEAYENVSRLGLPPNSAYLNSGVLAIDLAAWRRNHSSKQMLQLVMQQPDRWLYPDQDILAVQFADGWTRLPPEYNVTHRFFRGGDSLPLPTAEPHVVHFSGQGCKPWQSNRWHPFADEFWAVADVVRDAGFALPPRPSNNSRWYQRGPIAAYRNYRQRVRTERRERRACEQKSRRAAIGLAQNQMVGQFAADLTVRRGPFAGMKYPQAYSHGSTLVPKLLGTYEAELEATFQRFLAKDYPTVIDIGGAEGYYAVGAAMRWPRAHVIAYELQREARQAIEEMATENGVRSRLDIRAECMFGDLFGQRALVICDIEGCEEELLLSNNGPSGFADSDFIIETHDLFRPGVCQRLHEQFCKTHRVTVIDAVLDDQRPLQWSLPELASLTRQRQAEVIGERRGGPMKWLVCETRNAFPVRVLHSGHHDRAA